MDQVKEIILDVLEENSALCMDNEYERELAAELCEQALTKAVFAQLATLLGGNVECDATGRAVINTGVSIAASAQPLHDFLG